LAYTQALLRIRARRIVPLIPTIVAGQASYEATKHALTVTWPTQDNKVLVMDANLGDTATHPTRPIAGEILFSTHDVPAAADELRPWEVRVLLA
jgi:hypothetical protein